MLQQSYGWCLIFFLIDFLTNKPLFDQAEIWKIEYLYF